MSTLLCDHCGSVLVDGVDVCRTCGATSPPPVTFGEQVSSTQDWDEVIERLRVAVGSRYRIVRRLGIGGMAGVFLAEEPRLDRMVAIKVMSPRLMADRRFVTRFEREARTMARLTHPNIVTVYEIDEKDGLHYFAMQYIPGRSLSHIVALRTEPLPFEVIIHWLAQAGSAVAHAHRHGIVHRDIKPGNILLDSDGNAHVTDFGIAKVAEQSKLTSSGVIVGTPLYMSPEQCAGAPTTPASDQYALGIVAYELIADAPPFKGIPIALLNAHLNEVPRSLTSLRPDCPPQLAAVVSRMLEKEPTRRFPDVGEAMAAMNAQTVAEVGHARVGLRALAMPKTLRVTPESVSFQALGDSCMLTVRVVEWNGLESEPAEVDWRIGEPGVVDVDAAGTVRAVGNGITAIMVQSGRLATTIKAQVEQKAAQLAVEPIEIVLTSLGETTQLTMAVADRNGHSMAVVGEWVSSNPEIITVESPGSITAVGNGMASVECRVGSLASVIPVIVRQEVARVSFIAESLVFQGVGETAVVPVQVVDEGGSPVIGAAPLFESSDPDIVEVLSGGRARAVRDGAAEIRVTEGTAEARLPVVVRRRASRVVVTPSHVQLRAVGEQAEIRCEALDENDKPMAVDFRWESSDPGVAKVGPSGVISAVSDGDCRISVRGAGHSAVATVLVSQEPVSLSVKPEVLRLASLGEFERLTVFAVDARGNPIRALPQFAVASPKVAVVDGSGVVTAVRQGETTIFVTIRSLSRNVDVIVSQLPSAIRAYPESLDFDGLAQTASIRTEVVDARGNRITDRPLEWRTSDASIAEVDKEGVVRAVGRGAAIVTAHCDDVVARVRVVVDQPVGRVLVRPGAVRLTAIGASIRLTSVVKDKRGHTISLPVHWRSSDAAVAKVEGDGTITAMANGKATAHAVCGSAEARAQITVIQEPERIVVSPVELTFQAMGESRQLRADLLDANGHPLHRVLKWASSDDRVASVNGKGSVKAVGDGNATISVEYGRIHHAVAVRVKRVPVMIRVPEDNIQLDRPGVARKLVADLVDAAGQSVPASATWKSTNPDVAAATADGSVLAVAPGTAMLLASWEDLRAIVNVTVHPAKAPAVPMGQPKAPETGPKESPAAVVQALGPTSPRHRIHRGLAAIVVLTAAVSTTIILVNRGRFQVHESPGIAAGEPEGSSVDSLTVVSNGLDNSATDSATSNQASRSPPPVAPSPTPGRGGATRGANPLTDPDGAAAEVREVLDELMGALQTGDRATLRRLALPSADNALQNLVTRGYQPASWRDSPQRFSVISDMIVQIDLSVTIGSDIRQPPRSQRVIFDRSTGPWRVRSFK